MFENEIIHGDRRANRRYDLELQLRFLFEESGIQRVGAGHTVDLSRGGIRFQAADPPAAGTEVELRIEWPFLLQDVCPLELVVWGRIARRDDEQAAVQIRSYEFRTCGERSFVQAAGSARICSVIG